MIARLREMHRIFRERFPGDEDAGTAFGDAADEIESLSKIKCPDNPGGRHRWNGDGQCLDCCNYATDLIDSTLPTKDTK